MELLFTITACTSFFGLGALIYFLGHHLSTMSASAAQPTGLPLADRYRPMLRLLDEEEFRYLSDGGWTPSMVRKARKERRNLFRGYLHAVVKDYSRMFAGLRQTMVESHIDRPDLARILFRNRALFTLRLLQIEVHLALHAAGVGTVDVSGLIEVVETLRGASVSPITVGAVA